MSSCQSVHSLTGQFCLGLDASLFELKISIKEEVQQARMMLLKIPIYCEWRRWRRGATLRYRSELCTYFPLFSAYQKLKNSSEMVAWILSEHKLMGSILSQWLCRKEHQMQREMLEEQKMQRIWCQSTTGIRPLPKLQDTLTSHRWQRPRWSSPWHSDTVCEWRCERNRAKKGRREYVQCRKEFRSGEKEHSSNSFCLVKKKKKRDLKGQYFIQLLHSKDEIWVVLNPF